MPAPRFKNSIQRLIKRLHGKCKIALDSVRRVRVQVKMLLAALSRTSLIRSSDVTYEQAQNLRQQMALGLAGEMMLHRILDVLSKAADATDSVDDWLWWDRGASFVAAHLHRERAFRNGDTDEAVTHGR